MLNALFLLRTFHNSYCCSFGYTLTFRWYSRRNWKKILKGSQILHCIYTYYIRILHSEIFTFRSVSFYHSSFRWVSYSFIFPVIIETPFPKSPHGDYNQRLVMFNFRSDLSHLPSLHFLLISFTYVTVIKGVHLSFLVAGERTGIYTGTFHKAPLTGSSW